ncbi:hypothetical protein DFP72DRAFT_916395 [Ephemerocybe angulata]|uniref:DUF6534 domain-containing protein n=1 Tax=Ephemerocybe angulata TaxID=980116 RepID=A0A8H6HKA8_9AGAR|nr:hypothetical protein DFP72DRAFT_916395 [Tulosesus angulatus]
MSERNSPFPVYFEPSFPNLYGAQLIAAIINTFFFGAAFLLVLQYFNRHSRNDSIYIKVTVGALIFFATLQTIACTHQAYDAFILNFGKPERFNIIVFSAPLGFICSYVTAFVAQLFFATRIWIASQHFGPQFRLPVIPVILLACLQFGAGVAQTSLMFESGTYERLNLKTITLIETTCIQGASAALCDIIITATLCWIFRSHRTGIARTNTLVEKLSIYAINRAAATSVAVLLDVFLYYFCSGTYYFLIPLLVSTHLYVLSAVTVLTTREGLREDIEGSFHISHLVMSHGQSQPRSEDPSLPHSSTGNDIELVEDGKEKVRDTRV